MTHELRRIQTGRSVEAINKSIRKGFKPLLKKLEPSPDIYNKIAVIIDPKTNELSTIGDYRGPIPCEQLGWIKYYPYHWDLPFAAYLIPPDLKIGERVLLTDLIEDLIGESWNQGDTYRAEQAEAIWNGKDFEIDEDSITDSMMIG